MAYKKRKYMTLQSQREREVLNYLKKHKISLAVPTVVDDPVFSAAFHSSIDQPILTRNHLGDVEANNRAPDQSPYVSFFTEVYVYRNR